MGAFSLSHLSDADLRLNLTELVARECTTTADLLAHIAEFEVRRLYAPEGYPSTHAFCVHELHLSEEVAYKRIQAARAARDFPALFDAVADGRLHLTGVVLLAPKLTPENTDELIAAASWRTKAEIELLIAERFPQPDVRTMIRALPVRREALSSEPIGATNKQLDPDPVGNQPKSELLTSAPSDPNEQPAAIPAPVPDKSPPVKLRPLSAERYAIQVTVPKSTHDKLRRAQTLLGHAVPSGDVAQVLDRALDALISQLEKRKFAATDRPRANPKRHTFAKRTIPADVRRAVRARDGGQCTFFSDSGQRCQARGLLEYDHVIPIAHEGLATVDNIRLRCRAHNYYEAERVLGADFMAGKRRA